MKSISARRRVGNPKPRCMARKDTRGQFDKGHHLYFIIIILIKMLIFIFIYQRVDKMPLAFFACVFCCLLLSYLKPDVLLLCVI